MNTYYKAVRPDGASFHDQSFAWATKPGGLTTHPHTGPTSMSAADYLSVSTVPTDCTGMRWPCRLLEVEPVGDVFAPHTRDLPNKRAARAFRTVRELPAHEVLGANGEYVAALIERCSRLTVEDTQRLAAAWAAAGAAGRDAAGDAAWDAAGAAGRDAAMDAAGAAAWAAARDAAGALFCRDLIGQTFTQAHYDLLTGPWRAAVGPIHPDDAALKEDE